MAIVPDNISRPLLLLSRTQLSHQEAHSARQLCKEISDWNAFMAIAARKFSLPLVYRHLTELGPGVAPADILASMRGIVRQMALSTLSINAANQAFHKTCIEPLGASHVYLKGPSLAARYYDDPGMRSCRDIDVLVASDYFETVIRTAISNGYQIYLDPYEKPLPLGERDLRAVLRYSQVVTLISPLNVHIEVHRNVDRNMGIFDSKALLGDVDEINFGECRMNVLPTDVLFSYVCYHNTQHTWSRLHWLADLDAIIRHPTFNVELAIMYSRRLGLQQLAEACLRLNALSANPEAREKVQTEGHAVDLLELCLMNLGGDIDLEYGLILSQHRLGLPLRFFGSSKARRRAFVHHAIAGLTPGYPEYEAWPLPDWLQWLYYPMKTSVSLKKLFFRGRA